MAMTAAARKRKERENKAAHLAEMKAEQLVMTIYKGTRADLDAIKFLGGFEQDEEVFSLLIKNAAIILKRDVSQLNKLLGFNNEKVNS